MRLSTLFEGVSVKNGPLEDVEIQGITSDSQQVFSGSLYACLRGRHNDGHSFARRALEGGAVVILTEKRLPDLPEEKQCIVEDTRRAYAIICGNWNGNPARRLRLVGVTGTNGKTTTTQMIRQILEAYGEKVGLLGTIETVVDKRSSESVYTTPTPEILHRLLREMKDEGCSHVVMEVSSQALEQERMFGLEFECAAFTNLTQDHLDYHLTMENYYQAKRKLFEISHRAVINIDDSWGRRLKKEIRCGVTTFSTREKADISVSQAFFDETGSRFMMSVGENTHSVSIGLQGGYNIENAVCAAAVCIAVGLPEDFVVGRLPLLRPARGRLERVPTGKDFSLIIDYAHTPDALEKALHALRQGNPKRLVCLFGCGGDRDRKKRPLMGKVAAQCSDFVIVTSDNPRTEAPDAIIDDILAGMHDTTTPYVVIENRQEAIGYAVRLARPGDVVLLAGKGHETYQILDIGKVPFDEKQVIQGFLSGDTDSRQK